MEIKIATDSDQKSWDCFVQSQAGASPYLLFAWGKAVEMAYGHKRFYLIAEKQKEIVGIFPLVYMKPFWCSGQMLSLPYCDLGGCFSQDRDVAQALFSKALALVKSFNAQLLELRTRVSTLLLPQEYLPSMQTFSHKVSMVLDLPVSSESLWGSFKSKLRSQVRKAEKNGCTFSWGGLEQLDRFYEVFSLNMRDLGSPVHSRKWIESILKYFASNARMGLIHLGDRPIGAGIILCSGGQVAIPWASTLRSHNHLSPNMLLYWHFIKYAADHGYAQFDFGRSSPNEGTYKFKAQWGAKAYPLHWHRIHLNGKAQEDAQGVSMKRSYAEGIWRKLPLVLTNSLGPIIRRHISL